MDFRAAALVAIVLLGGLFAYQYANPSEQQLAARSEQFCLSKIPELLNIGEVSLQRITTSAEGTATVKMISEGEPYVTCSVLYQNGREVAWSVRAYSATAHRMPQEIEAALLLAPTQGGYSCIEADDVTTSCSFSSDNTLVRTYIFRAPSDALGNLPAELQETIKSAIFICHTNDESLFGVESCA